MKKFFLVGMFFVFFLAVIGTSSGTETPQYWIEVEKVIKTSISITKNQTFQISVKSWGMEISNILVKVNFKEFYYRELGNFKEIAGYTDEEGRTFFTVPYCDKERGRDITVSLPDFPETREKSAIIIYVRHLKYFGHTFTGVEGVGTKENYFEETGSYSNIALIQSSSVKEDIRKILEAAKNGMWSLLSVDHVFFEIKFENGRTKNIRLWPDYLERWLEYIDQIQPFKNKIIGFLGLDEPWWNAIVCGIPFKEMRQMTEEVAFQIKKRFPNKKMMGSIYITERELAWEKVYGYPLPADAWEYYSIPPNYDWVGVYHYWAIFKERYPNGDFPQFARIWSERLQSFEKHMLPHQRIILVPGVFTFASLMSKSAEEATESMGFTGFGLNQILQSRQINLCSSSFPSMEKLEQELVNLAPMYLGLAKRGKQVVAIMPFLWPNTGNLIGLEELPDLKKTWEEIGKEITWK